MDNNEIVQLKSYDDKTGKEIGNVLPITNSEAVKVKNNKKLTEILTELDNKIEQTNASLDNIEINKASKQELDSQKARIDLLTKLQNGETDGNSELLDIRNGVNGIQYNLSGDAVRDSLNAIYNGLGGVYCKDITNINEYAPNSSFGTIKNKNTITTNATEINIVPTYATKANRNYLVYCSEEIYNLTTVDTSLGTYADKGVFYRNIGFITPKVDKNVIFIEIKGLTINKDVHFYLIDVTGTSITQENYKYFDEKYINSWFFKEIDNIITTKNVVKNDGKVFDLKIWQEETWEKIDNETILTLQDKTSTIKLAENPTQGNKYLVLFTGKITQVRTLKDGLWNNAGTITNNIGEITIVNNSDALFFETTTGGKNKVYLIDVTNNIELEKFVKEYGILSLGSDYTKAIDKRLLNLLVTANTVKNVGEVDGEKLWSTDKWIKIDDTTINLPYDAISTITIKKDLKLGSKYAVLFTGIIKEIKTIDKISGSWSNIGSVNNNVGLIDIKNECTSLELITGSSGKHNIYCVDITNNIELEKFVVKYGVQAIDCDYKSNIYKKMLDIYNTVASTPTTESTWNGKKWIAYGDSITEQNSYTQKVAKALGLKMINKGIGGTTVADQDGNNINAFCRDERINTFDKDADLVTIMGTTNDWDRSEMGDLTYNNGFDTSKVKGALATTIIKIQNRCPNATIVVCSPIGGRYSQSGVNGNIPIADKYGKTTYDLAKACEEVAEFMNVHYCNTWSCGINNWNRIDNLEDAVHPTQDKGTDKIAVKLIGTLQSIAPLI